MKPRANFHAVLSKMLFESWFIEPGVHSSMMQQLRVRIESGRLHIDDSSDDAPIAETASTSATEAGSGVAIVRVFGILGKHLSLMETLCGGCDVDYVKAALREAASEPGIHTIILFFNTPGGLYTGIPELAAFIAELRRQKTVIAFVDGRCCSAGYWLASQCGEFYCTHSASIGSINGFIAAVDKSAEWEKTGWALELFTGEGGDLKAIGIEGKKWTDTEREYVQARVVKQVSEFKSAVRAGRGAVADSTMRGQSFDGDEAIAVNLVDANVRDLDEVVEAALAAHYLSRA